MLNEKGKIGWILLGALGVPIGAGTMNSDLMVAAVAAELLVALLIMGWMETRR
jgi:hypothetical protein